MSRPALLVRTPQIDYHHAWEIQRSLATARAAGEIPDILWLLEHPPTYTTGRHGTRADLFLSDDALAAAGAQFVATDRGGQMTWHGPGQTVGYPIYDLRPAGRVRGFVEALVASMAVASGVDEAAGGQDAVGLYVQGRKIGSVGIRVRSGVTYHGLALNREPDLDWLRAMTACGAPDVAPTSIATEGGNPDRDRVEQVLADQLAERLGMDLTPAPTELLEQIHAHQLRAAPGAE